MVLSLFHRLRRDSGHADRTQHIADLLPPRNGRPFRSALAIGLLRQIGKGQHSDQFLPLTNDRERWRIWDMIWLTLIVAPLVYTQVGWLRASWTEPSSLTTSRSLS